MRSEWKIPSREAHRKRKGEGLDKKLWNGGRRGRDRNKVGIDKLLVGIVLNLRPLENENVISQLPFIIIIIIQSFIRTIKQEKKKKKKQKKYLILAATTKYLDYN